MAKHAWEPPARGTIEGELFAHNVVKSSRQFLQGNPENGKTMPSLTAWNAAADHLYKHSGDIRLFQGQPAPKGRRAK